MERIIEYPTHILTLSQERKCQFTKITNYVNGKVYDDMVTAIIMDDARALHFVHFERKLIHGFLNSLVSFHNKKYKDLLPKFYCFDRELSYYEFCVENDLPFNEQEWFKTAYIKDEINNASDYLTNASILLIKTLYPEFIDPIRDVLLEIKVPTIPKVIFEPSPSVAKHVVKPSLYKCNPKDYEYFLKDNNINMLYHFTDTRNFESIKTNGICSIHYLKNSGIKVHFASSFESRDIDKKKNTLEYVHLSYERKNPMLFIALKEGRLSDYVILEVSTDVIFLRDTMFTHCNAAKNGVVFSKELSYMMQIPFKQFHNKIYERDSPYKDFFVAEILVKDRVAPSYILNLDQW